MGNADPNEAYDEENKHLAFELREQAGQKMAQQDAVVKGNQRNMQEQGGFRTYIGREDIRRRGDRPQYSGEVRLVDAIEGNRVKDAAGNTFSMTLAKPVPDTSASTAINVRLAGSTAVESKRRRELQKYADSLKTILATEGTIFTSRAVTELMKKHKDYKKEFGNTKFAAFLKLFPETFEMQTASAGGTSKVTLVRS